MKNPLDQALNASNLPVICVFLARVAMPKWSEIVLGHYPICVAVQGKMILWSLECSYEFRGSDVNITAVCWQLTKEKEIVETTYTVAICPR